jgi:C1A family cysteine protease
MYRIAARFGWKPDLPDHRDLKYSAPRRAKLPSKVDLAAECPPVYDQGQLGSCSANAIGAAFEFELLKQKLPDFMPSRLFIYYNERVIENTVNSDSGAQIRDGIKSISAQGVCSETIWPYVISEFEKKPFLACYQEALNNKAVAYYRVAQRLTQLKGCLASGYPVVIGFTVYSAFESPAVAKSGVLNLPAKGEKVVGGHAVLVVGYDNSSRRFIVRNSWGAGWGKKGYFTMPYDYLTNDDLSSDFWTVRVVTDAEAAAIQAQIEKKSAK